PLSAHHVADANLPLARFEVRCRECKAVRPDTARARTRRARERAARRGGLSSRRRDRPRWATDRKPDAGPRQEAPRDQCWTAGGRAAGGGLSIAGGAGAVVVVLVALVALRPPHYLVPDSAGHVAWARSLLWDRAVDFSNDYARLGMIDREGTIQFGATTGRGR